jgi:hypothetical protein
MIQHDFEVEILVNGRPIKTYNHRGQFFVEGRQGSAYELKIHNNTWGRVEVVPSVDGLSVMRDGPAGPDDSGYLVPSRSSIVIPGFRRNNDVVAEFLFADKRDSYSAATGQGTENVGVIGLMVFKERVVYNYNITSIPNTWIGSGHISGSGTGVPYNGNPCFNVCDTSNNNVRNIASTLGGSSAASLDSVSVGSSMNSPRLGNFELGTDWGDEKSHHVREVSFDRENPHHPENIITIYYDSKRGLEKRGIRVGKPSRKKKPTTPNPFPGYDETGCTPPPSWNGRRRR